MTTRNLDALFEPKSIALIGASNQLRSVGAVTAKNLFEAGFAGPIVMVNPHEQAIRSTINYHSVEELPLAPDLAVIATPPPTVPEIVASLGARGTRAVIVVTTGFGEGGSAEGAELRRRTLEAAKRHLVRILGPNCLGFISPSRGINASFAHLTPLTGGLAFISQSGALVTAAIDWATARGFGFSHVISIGDMTDVDFGDLLDYLALDQLTHAILLYVESIVEAQKFMSAGRIAARNKPVLVHSRVVRPIPRCCLSRDPTSCRAADSANSIIGTPISRCWVLPKAAGRICLRTWFRTSRISSTHMGMRRTALVPTI